MSPLEYLGHSLPFWHEYALLLALFLALHWVLARRWAVGIYDPMFMLLMSNVFGWTIVWFMYVRGDIAAQYVVSFSAAQLAFYAGIGAGRWSWRSPARLPAPADDVGVPRMALALAATVHLASTLTVWSLVGIPLFRPSRLGAFEGSGGYGILERLAESSGLIAVFSAVYLLVRHRDARGSLVVAGFVLWYLATIALSGSKGALLSVGQYVLSILFVYTGLRHRKDRFWGGWAGKVLIAVSAVFAVGVLVVQQQEEADLAAAALAFAFRIVSYGDVYVFAYPDATIEALQGTNAMIGMFGGFLSTFRLLPLELVHTNLGLQFTGIVFPELDLIVGPNPQHPVFGYHYFGSLGVVFSFVLGLVTVGAQARFYRHPHSTFLSGLAAFLLYFAVAYIAVDFEYAMSKLASTIIGAVVVLGPVLALRPHVPIMFLRRPDHAKKRTDSPS
jgi:hypothetical protein